METHLQAVTGGQQASECQADESGGRCNARETERRLWQPRRPWQQENERRPWQQENEPRPLRATLRPRKRQSVRIHTIGMGVSR